MTSKTKYLTVFSLVMITVVSVDSIRNLPAAALFGPQLVFFYMLGGLLFLLPCAFVSAELSSTWPKEGGVFVWVKHAFGEKTALLAIWLQWIENVIWYPTLLSFVAGTTGYLIFPSLAESKIFLIAVIICCFWGTTWINLKGIQTSARFSTLCSIAGLLLPMALIIALGGFWLIQGKPIEIQLSAITLVPNFADSHLWVSLTAIMLSFCGMEIATVHANDVKEPQKSYPKALIIASFIILFTLILGSLSLALVVPQNDMSLVAGIMQAVDVFLKAYHLEFLLPLVGVAVILGGLGGVNNWVIAPTRGLMVAAKEGLLPHHLGIANEQGAPKYLLIYQAIIVTLLCAVFLFMPGINGSYWLLTVLAAQLYMVMYMIMFAAAIYVRYKYPHIQRAFTIPGGKIGLWLVAGAGFVGSLLTFIVGYIPPSNIDVGSTTSFIVTLIVGFLLMSAPPFLAFKKYKGSAQPA